MPSDLTQSTDAARRESDDSASTVYIRFSPSQGPRLRRPEPTTCGDGSPLWVKRPILMQRASGTYELIGTSRNLEGLVRWVLSHGTDAEVRGPEVLRQQIAVQARSVWRQYVDD